MADAEDRSPHAWGSAAAAVTAEERNGLAELVAARFSGTDMVFEPARDWRTVVLATPRLTVPPSLAAVVSHDRRTRLLHAAGRSYTDLVRARRGDYGRPPDVVATPRDAGEVAAVLEWCADAGAACVPFGGGTSVVGGVNPPAVDMPVVTLQTRRMDRVLEVDTVSRAARMQAGVTGPSLEEQLRPSGLTLRFFPQSFEYSTLGGWLATRAGGHYATRLTHVDDLVESITAVTPAGPWSSRRLPASGAGPSPDRLLLGSEGILGVITEAWVRLQPRPEHRASVAVRFPRFTQGAAAVRTLVQSGLEPAGCRLLDPTEALLNGAGEGTSAVLLIALESAWRPVEDDLAVAVTMCRDAGGVAEDGRRAATTSRWRESFLRAPYLRDALLGLGVLVETFETATTWDHFDETVTEIVERTTAAVVDVCGDGLVTCRITHAYPDGAAPYFTVLAPARRGSEAVQWQQIKAAAAEAVEGCGATITHHHAVGRDHRPWYDRQRPDPFARALTAAKAALDPQGLLNPGVLLG